MSGAWNVDCFKGPPPPLLPDRAGPCRMTWKHLFLGPVFGSPSGCPFFRFWGQHGSQMAPKIVPKRSPSRLPDAPRTGLTNRRAFPLFFRFFFLRPMCLKHSKYCIEPTFHSVATPPKNGPKKHRKNTPKTLPNHSKIGPRRLPNATPKNRRS